MNSKVLDLFGSFLGDAKKNRIPPREIPKGQQEHTLGKRHYKCPRR